MRTPLRTAPVLTLSILVIFGCGSEAAGEETPQVTDSGKSVSVENFVMEWSFEGDQLTVTMSAPTSGWIAVGFDPSAAMKDADLILGYVEDGTVYLRDDWGDGHISHKPDTDLGGTDNAEPVSGEETLEGTTITFSIPLDSGDSYDSVLAEGTTHKVIMAYGPDGADNFTGMHAWADTIELEL